MKRIYLVLAVLGAILPYVFFLQHFNQAGLALEGFVAGLFANPAAAGFTVDLLFTSLVFWLFMFTQWRRGKGPAPWLFVALNLLIGLSCALPAYLFAREKGNDELAGVGTTPSTNVVAGSR